MTLQWAPTFDKGLPADLIPQCKDPSRITFPVVDRTGRPALMLTTQPGDQEVVVANGMERCDVYRAVPGTQGAVIHGEGSSFWMANSIYPPDAFQMPSWQAYVVAAYHEYPNDAAAASWHINFQPPGVLSIARYTGDKDTPTAHIATAWVPPKNQWLDFVHHFRWSSKSDGYAHTWLNGRLICSHLGPTLYPGHGCYLKLSNYRYPTTPNAASSVIHDCIRIGTTRASVEGV